MSAGAESQGEAPKRRVSKSRKGVVVSAKMDKTVIVSVERRVKHRAYGKYLTVRKRYAVHDMLDCAVGDAVQITECRRISKTKHWRVSSRLSGGPTQAVTAAQVGE